MKSSTPSLPPLKAVKVLDQLRERIRYLHYSLRTEETYVKWVRSFIRFHDLRHPAMMGGDEVEEFLSYLANTRHVAASTHKQALSALLFFYGKVLGVHLPWMKEIGRPRTKRRLPVVLSPDEVARILCFLEGEHRLFAQLLYGTGMRINEGLQLRVKDVDFGRSTIIVREGKGGKDRAVMLPQRLVPALQEQMARARLVWSADQAAGRGGVAMPDALDRKYPRAGASWSWFWVFPQDAHSIDPPVRRGAPSPYVRSNVPTGVQAGVVPHRHRQDRYAALAASLLCDRRAAGRLRHSYGAGAAWPCRCGHNDDLHPRTESRRWWRTQPL